MKSYILNKSSTFSDSTNTCLSGALILLKILVKKGENSRNIVFRVMPPCLGIASSGDEQVYQVWC